MKQKRSDEQAHGGLQAVDQGRAGAGSNAPAGVTTIFLVRHTDVHNPEDILYGRLPRFGLSGLGREQAERTASALAQEPLTAIYSSPQLRARQTAAVIAARYPHLAVKISKTLSEVLTGWQGRPHSALAEINFDFYNNPLSAGDESIPDVWARISRFVQRARKRNEGGAVVAVTHGDVVAVARAGYLRKPLVLASLRLPNVYPGKGSLLRLTFSDPLEVFPGSIEYYDPNGDDPRYAQGWVSLEPSEVGMGSVA